MNWVPIKNQPSALLQEFRLMQKTDCKMVLKYNPHQHSVRFTSEGKYHRLFYFETAGPLASKTIVMDQYGMERGSIVFDKIYNGAAMVEMEGKKYYCQVQARPSSPKIVLYENNPAQPWISCDFDMSAEEGVKTSFILGLCWFVFLQQEKEHLVEYAA